MSVNICISCQGGNIERSVTTLILYRSAMRGMFRGTVRGRTTGNAHCQILWQQKGNGCKSGTLYANAHPDPTGPGERDRRKPCLISTQNICLNCRTNRTGTPTTLQTTRRMRKYNPFDRIFRSVSGRRPDPTVPTCLPACLRMKKFALVFALDPADLSVLG